MVIISHCQASAERADRVAFPEDGQLMGLGTHQELLATNLDYAALWEQPTLVVCPAKRCVLPRGLHSEVNWG
jgi:ABC-type multidrug transport system fused ATPase/permease subunit